MQPRIDEYRFGYIVVDGKSYTHDIIITPDRVIPNWWRIKGHRLQLEDVKQYLDIEVDAVVIGTGYNGLMQVDKEVIEEFKKRGRKIYILTSREAVKKYNELTSKGQKTMLFIHLTC